MVWFGVWNGFEAFLLLFTTFNALSSPRGDHLLPSNPESITGIEIGQFLPDISLLNSFLSQRLRLSASRLDGVQHRVLESRLEGRNWCRLGD